jgi:hypothetical protein
MRPLNITELEDKIKSDSSGIIYSNRVYTQDKITHFLAFLHGQPISKRILARIVEDFSIIKKEMPASSSVSPNRRPPVDHRIIKAVKENIKDRQDQGALGFFVIQELFEVEQKYENHYLDAPSIWYDGGRTTFDESFNWFKEKFFEPFVELLEWYIYESQVKSEKDYYSKSEIIIINEKLDKLLQIQTASAQVVFDEVEELKELILFLNKKNWLVIFKEKFKDLTLAEIVNHENFVSFLKEISKNIPSLNP